MVLKDKCSKIETCCKTFMHYGLTILTVVVFYIYEEVDIRNNKHKNISKCKSCKSMFSFKAKVLVYQIII